MKQKSKANSHRKQQGTSWSKYCGLITLAALAHPELASALEVGKAVSAESVVAEEPGNNGALDMFSPVTWRYRNWRGFVSFSVQARYDDNIRLEHDNRLADFIGVAVPAINVEYLPVDSTGDTLVHFDYAPEFVGYLRHHEFDSLNHLAHIKAEHALGHSQLRFSHTLNITTESALEQTSWGQTHTERTEFAWAYQATDKTSLTFSAHQEWAQVENDLTLWEYGAALEWAYRLSDKTTVLASYDATKISSNPGVDGFQQAVLAGLSWDLSSLCRLDLTAGVQTMSTEGAETASNPINPDINLVFRYQFAPKTGLRLQFTYDNRYSRYIANQLNEMMSVQAAITHNLTDKLGLELHGGLQNLKQQNTDRAAINGGDLLYWNAGLSLIYHYNARTNVRLEYTHQERGKNGLYSPFERNLIQLEFQYRF